MEVIERECKSILVPSKISSVDYCINPYTGCTHNCLYCYASFMQRYSGLNQLPLTDKSRQGLKWGHFVIVKINAPEVLKKEITKRRPGDILISSVCDPYQPIERKYKLTRKILKILLNIQTPLPVNWAAQNEWSISILTKSDLVLRDLDLLKKFTNLEVGLTITTLDPKITKMFEPHSSSPQKRLKALEILKRNKIKTYAFVGPVIPYFGDSQNNLAKLFAELEKIKIDYLLIDKMSYLKSKCKQKLGELIRKFDQPVRDYFAFAQTREYEKQLRDRVVEALKNKDLDYRIIF